MESNLLFCQHFYWIGKTNKKKYNKGENLSSTHIIRHRLFDTIGTIFRLG